MNEELQILIKKLQELKTISDYEASHSLADDILLEIIELLANNEDAQAIHSAFMDVGRWYV